MLKTYGPIAASLMIGIPLFLLPHCFSERSFTANLLLAWIFGISAYLVASQIAYLDDRVELSKAKGIMNDTFWIIPSGLRQEIRFFLLCLFSLLVLDFMNFPFLVLIPIVHMCSVILMQPFIRGRRN